MKQYEYLLFDLDGTITDPALGITNSVMHALKKFGITANNRNDLFKFIGPPLWDSFERYYGFTKDEAKTAVEYYREYYKSKGIFENYVYNGMEDLLKELKANGKSLIVLLQNRRFLQSGYWITSPSQNILIIFQEQILMEQE